jgi:hypothetical protein
MPDLGCCATEKMMIHCIYDYSVFVICSQSSVQVNTVLRTMDLFPSCCRNHPIQLDWLDRASVNLLTWPQFPKRCLYFSFLEN